MLNFTIFLGFYVLNTFLFLSFIRKRHIHSAFIIFLLSALKLFLFDWPFLLSINPSISSQLTGYDFLISPAYLHFLVTINIAYFSTFLFHHIFLRSKFQSFSKSLSFLIAFLRPLTRPRFLIFCNSLNLLIILIVAFVNLSTNSCYSGCENSLSSVHSDNNFLRLLSLYATGFSLISSTAYISCLNISYNLFKDSTKGVSIWSPISLMFILNIVLTLVINGFERHFVALSLIVVAYSISPLLFHNLAPSNLLYKMKIQKSFLIWLSLLLFGIAFIFSLFFIRASGAEIFSFSDLFRFFNDSIIRLLVFNRLVDLDSFHDYIVTCFPHQIALSLPILGRLINPLLPDISSYPNYESLSSYHPSLPCSTNYQALLLHLGPSGLETGEGRRMDAFMSFYASGGLFTLFISSFLLFLFIFILCERISDYDTYMNPVAFGFLSLLLINLVFNIFIAPLSSVVSALILAFLTYVFLLFIYSTFLASSRKNIH